MPFETLRGWSMKHNQERLMGVLVPLLKRPSLQLDPSLDPGMKKKTGNGNERGIPGGVRHTGNRIV